MEGEVFKKKLSNGMSVVLIQNSNIPKVSVQLWYHVGSQNEKSGQKGIAHLIEHMIFKGTHKLSESDINIITYKLSGYCNAFTSYDYTGYLFDMPTQNWKKVLPIMADCMSNCTFKEELLNSELKAVIQELKMYNDDYISTLLERMIGAIFFDHPYRYPIIGYKHDLWNLKRETLVEFYKKHYVPNNATLIIVGDIEPHEAYACIEDNFGSIPSSGESLQESFYHLKDIEARSVALFRDIQQPMCLVAWVIPGIKSKCDYLLDILSWVVGAGKSSRLYEKIVDELGLALELDSFNYDLFDYGLFIIHFQPKRAEDIEKIIRIIQEELDDLAHNFISDEELIRARKKTEMDFIALQENNQKRAYILGKTFLATGDEYYLKNYLNYPEDEIKPAIQALVKNYLRSSVMHRGSVLPIPESEKPHWLQVQEISDQEDKRVLSRIVREAEVEPPLFAHTITSDMPVKFNFPQAQKATLKNGLKVFYYHNPQLPKIEIILDLEAKHFYDPANLQGLSMFMFDTLEEGTKKYTGTQFAQELESRGMELNTIPGQITLSMLSQDAQKGFELLYEMITNATFLPDSIEKIRHQMIGELKNFWDSPLQCAGQLVKQEIYKEHPYSKNILGTFESVQAIKRADLLRAYSSFLTPHKSRISIVGNFEDINILDIVESTLGAWKGAEIKPLVYPPIKLPNAHTVNYPINRDQIVLAFGGLSIERKDSRFDPILLFDQIFTGGILGSMSSRLFELRERSGLFYTIGGSLLAGVGLQPGIFYVKTVVSLDRLCEAEREIENVIQQGASTMTQGELEEAQQAVANSLVDHFGAYRNVAATFLFLDEYGLPVDYFNNRAQMLYAIQLDDVKKAVKSIVNAEHLVKVRVGRL